MLENELKKELKAVLDAGFTARGMTDVVVRQNNQPRQEGASSGKSVYFYKIGTDHRYGSPQRKDEWDLENLQMVHTEKQKYETTFQISTLYQATPTNITAITAGDLANIAAAILQSDATITAFRVKNVGVLRITEVRNQIFENDKDQFESSASFDVTLTHDVVDVTTTPTIETVEYNVIRI